MKKILILLIAITLSTGLYASEKIQFKNFKLKSILGNMIDTENLKNKKIVLNFWATWCPPCVKEIPLLNQLKNNYKGDDYVFLAINAGDKVKKIKKFLTKHKFDFEILYDLDKKISKGMGVLSLPRTLILDLNRKIIYNSNIPPKKL